MQSNGTKAIRFTAAVPKADLLGWYESYAEAENISVNAALLRGLTAHRAAVMRMHERAALRAEGREAARLALSQQEGGTAHDAVSSA